MSDQTWTEPGAYPVAPGVHRIPLPLPMDGLRAVNVYAIETGDGLTMVDGGWAIPEAREVFVDGLRQLGAGLGDVRRFLVTHMHRDHYTQAVAVRREVGSHVALGAGEQPTMAMIGSPDSAESGTAPMVRRLAAAGASHLADAWRSADEKNRPSVADYAAPDTWLADEQRLEVGEHTLEAVATPGHTQGHVVFVDRGRGLLFAGDHVLPHITPSIGFEAAWVQQPLRDFLGSLARVRALPDLQLLPAHGPVTGSTHARVDELIDFHDVRLARSLEAVSDGGRTAWEVAERLPWTRREKRASDLNPFDAALAAFETLAHLELLALRGSLTRDEVEGTMVFAPTATAP